jgi:hypothetical protein
VVDDVLLLAEEEPFPLHRAASPARRRLDSAVGAATSRMVEEFLHVRVWDASPLRAAADRLSLASSGVSLLVFPSAGDRTSSASSGGAAVGWGIRVAPGGMGSREDGDGEKN